MNPSALTNLLRENPIVVTGMGSFSAAGDSVDELWKGVVAGRGLAASRVFGDDEEQSRFAVCGAPEIDLRQPELHSVRRMDRCVQMAWLAANQAWQQARLENAYAPERVGVIVGSSRGPFGKWSESVNSTKGSRPPPTLVANSTFASLSGALAQGLNLNGPGATVAATCASAAFAVAFAAEQILLGKADAMLVGGTEAPLHSILLTQLRSAGVVASHEDAAQCCRPFDISRNGLVLGEGSGFLILESARAAAARQATCHANLAGWATSVDNCGRTGVSEDGAALCKVMTEALQLAGLSPDDIDYINAHGTGTKLNDVTEALAVSELLGSRIMDVPCTSTKPVTGHCLGATPALEAIVSIESLRHQMIPPTANCFSQDPACAIDAQPLNARPAKISTVMSNSLGFWGYHASLIFSSCATT